MKHIKAFLSVTAALSLTATLHAAGEGWTNDFEAAKAQAAKEGKDLLMDFTGSDWCGWCIKLDKEVFQHDAFKEGVKDKFVLVILDYPRDESKLSEETIEQNAELKKVYPVRGYPTILLTDAQGKPYAKTGYRRGGPEAYVNHLDELIKIRKARDEAVAKMEKAEGVEKAKAIVAAIESMQLDDAMLKAHYGSWLEQIADLDPNDETGYVKSMKQQERMDEFRKELNQLARKKDMEGAIHLVDQTLAEGGFEAAQTQRMIMTKAMIYANMERFDESLESIDKAIAADPEGESNASILKMRERIEAAKAKQAEDAAPAEGEDAPPAEGQGAADKEPIRARDK